MRSVFRATALLSSSSVAILAAGIVSSKVYSVLLGPGGFGVLGILQSLLSLLTVAAGTGIGTAVVRAGAIALAQEDHRHVGALRNGAWLLVVALGLPAAIVLAVFRTPISFLLFGEPMEARSVALTGLALLFNLTLGVQVAILNAYHRLGSLGKATVIGNVAGAMTGVSLIWLGGDGAIGPAVVAMSATAWVVSFYYFKRDVPTVSAKPSGREMIEAVRTLLRFGGPLMAATLVGAGVQLIVPILVMHTLGAESVGHYRAAAIISLGYALLLTASAPDYYVRLSAASDRPATLVQLINLQHRIVMGLALPVLLGVLALAHYLIPVLYSSAFAPAEDVLVWQLTGGLFNFSAWTMSTVILARRRSTVFFCTESIAALVVVLGSWIGMRWYGVAGVGMAFMVAAIVNYVAVSAIVRRDIGMVWTAENRKIMMAALAAIVVTTALSFAGLERVRTPLALLFAIAAGLGSLYVVWTETRKPEHA